MKAEELGAAEWVIGTEPLLGAPEGCDEELWLRSIRTAFLTKLGYI